MVKRYQVERVGIGRDVILDGPGVSRISTSHVERQNLTMRMGMRCLTRLADGFSKKA